MEGLLYKIACLFASPDTVTPADYLNIASYGAHCASTSPYINTVVTVAPTQRGYSGNSPGRDSQGIAPTCGCWASEQC